MSVGKVFEFPSKPEQLGLSSSILLEVMYVQIQVENPETCGHPVMEN